MKATKEPEKKMTNIFKVEFSNLNHSDKRELMSSIGISCIKTAHNIYNGTSLKESVFHRTKYFLENQKFSRVKNYVDYDFVERHNERVRLINLIPTPDFTVLSKLNQNKIKFYLKNTEQTELI